MPGLLELTRNRSELRRQLVRRIGYTNGLHDVCRFGRLVEYAYPLIPTSMAELKAELADRENSLQPSGTDKPLLSPNNYVRGIIDVARALGLLDKVGEKISLSDKGYAFHAIKHTTGSDDAIHAFLLMAVLDADGEYFLNLLDLVNGNMTSADDIGPALFDRIFRLIEFKSRWVEDQIESPIIVNTLKSELADVRRVLKEALASDKKSAGRTRSPFGSRRLSPQGRTRRFFAHTVGPRREWLADLGCLVRGGHSGSLRTIFGERLIRYFDENDCRATMAGTSFLHLPLSETLAQSLGARHYQGPRNLFWRAIATARNGHCCRSDLADRELLDRIITIYPHLTIRGFNQADTASLFHALSCEESLTGAYLDQSTFDDSLIRLTKTFPGEIFRLSKRRGIGGYIALRRCGRGTTYGS